jgi:uncharacterized protein with von Willebrand factor type A (vWA) domain
MMQEKPSGNLLHNLILFGRLLRALGMDVNPGRMIDLVQALEYVEIGRKEDFYYTARSLLVHDPEDLPLFDQAFELFWRKRAEGSFSLGSLLNLGREEESAAPVVVPPPLQELDAPDTGTGEEENDEEGQEIIEITKTYSRREVLRQKDFSQLMEAELDEIKQFMAAMIWQLGQRRTRRLKPGRRGNRLDLRRSLRRNLRYGGEILEWPRRRRKSKPRPLILLADISGSMERYTRLLLHFVYSLAKGLDQQVESFVFGTRLTRITRQIRRRQIEQALDEVSQTVTDWGGGTRIGQALKTFNFEWGRRVLGRGAVVLLISDGWDRGDPELLQQEIGRLQRSCYRLVWLNPLLGSSDYEPLTRGMQAALPHVDDFLPVHNLASLEDLATHLIQLTTERRPSRHQQINPTGAAFIRPR